MEWRESIGKETTTHLDDLVPSGRDDDGVERVGGESDTRDPMQFRTNQVSSSPGI